jgi:hypothetical protein
LAHTNMVPLGLSMGQPARFNPSTKRVAALPIDLDDLLHTIVRTVQGDDGSDLDGLKHAVVQVALYSSESRDKQGVAHAKADPPPGHGVALGKGEKLHPDLFRPGTWRKLGGVYPSKTRSAYAKS